MSKEPRMPQNPLEKLIDLELQCARMALRGEFSNRLRRLRRKCALMRRSLCARPGELLELAMDAVAGGERCDQYKREALVTCTTANGTHEGASVSTQCVESGLRKIGIREVQNR